MRKRAFELLKNWCDTLLTYKVETSSPYTDGALLCPACHVLHGRVADLCFPLTLLWAKTEKDEYLDSADKLINWSEYNLINHEGLWYNDITSRWYGTSIFSALSIGEAILNFSDKLPSTLKEKWLGIFLRMTDTVATLEVRDAFLLTVTNYYCGAATLLAMAWKITGDEKYYEKSKFWISNILSRFDNEGLLFGEGTIEAASDGSHTIDMGYNLEESLPVLIRYSSLTGEYSEFFREKLKAHLDFLLPDGGIDNSWGTRHNKWTYWGSRTSDGITEGLALVLDDPMFADACERVITLYENCTHNGLLAMPMAHESGEPTCLHHTFTHAKALAALICANDVPDIKRTVLPREKEYGIKVFQSGNLVLVSKGKFRATFSSCKADYLGDNNANRGGSMNLLYHIEYGIICAATSAVYVPTELLNQQHPRRVGTPPCMTAQFIMDGKQGCLDTSAVISTEGDNVVRVTAEGWSAVYTFGEEYLDIFLECKDGTYNIPVVCSHNTEVILSDNRKLLTSKGITLTSDTPIDTDIHERVFHPVGGLVYLPISVKVNGNAHIKIK
ncbi:MAG: hypothetical protein IJO52_04470 [Clostridia bacterium]|nr:hypothetical protein [Clostridia bacterium]